jgi:hypothetical protein
VHSVPNCAQRPNWASAAAPGRRRQATHTAGEAVRGLTALFFRGEASSGYRDRIDDRQSGGDRATPAAARQSFLQGCVTVNEFDCVSHPAENLQYSLSVSWPG